MGAKICIVASATLFVMACSNSVTGPSKVLSSLAISGPSSIAPGATGTFVATARFSDGTSADYSTSVTWTSTNTNVSSSRHTTSISPPLRPRKLRNRIL